MFFIPKLFEFELFHNKVSFCIFVSFLGVIQIIIYCVFKILKQFIFRRFYHERKAIDSRFLISFLVLWSVLFDVIRPSWSQLFLSFHKNISEHIRIYFLLQFDILLNLFWRCDLVKHSFFLLLFIFEEFLFHIFVINIVFDNWGFVWF